MKSTHLLTALALTLASIPTASAYRLVDSESVKLDINGWAQAGYQVINAPGASDIDHGPYLGMARLAGRVTYTPWGSAFIQIDGDQNGVSLLDAIAQINVHPVVSLRMGKFKVPTSLDFLIPAPKTPFVNRAQLVSAVQKRLLGGEIDIHHDFGPLSLAVQLGWFARGDMADPGHIASVRLLLSTPSGFGLHVAFASEVIEPDAAPKATFDDQLDIGLEYASGPWTARIEGVIVLDHASDVEPFGAYGELLYNHSFANGMSLEPGIHYGVLSVDGITTHRGTVGLTWYLLGDHLQMSTNFEMLAKEGELGQSAYLQFQAGF